MAFADLVGQVQEGYQRLGHQLGWRFLYSPEATLSPNARLAFAGLNPGGSAYHPPVASVEEGNAYRIERWAGDNGLNPLQLQIRAFYEALCTQLQHPSTAQVMDETLALNFCPFRSPTWEALPNQAESTRFSAELWRQVLGLARPSVRSASAKPQPGEQAGKRKLPSAGGQ